MTCPSKRGGQYRPGIPCGVCSGLGGEGGGLESGQCGAAPLHRLPCRHAARGVAVLGVPLGVELVHELRVFGVVGDVHGQLARGAAVGTDGGEQARDLAARAIPVGRQTYRLLEVERRQSRPARDRGSVQACLSAISWRGQLSPTAFMVVVFVLVVVFAFIVIVALGRAGRAGAD